MDKHLYRKIKKWQRTFVEVIKYEPRIKRFNTGRVSSINFYRNNRSFNERFPAFIGFHGNGRMSYISFVTKGGGYHRSYISQGEEGCGPASIHYNLDGSIHSKTYYKNGKKHRSSSLPKWEGRWTCSYKVLSSF